MKKLDTVCIMKQNKNVEYKKQRSKLERLSVSAPTVTKNHILTRVG